MQHEGSLSPAIKELKKRLDEKSVKRKLIKVQKYLNIMKQDWPLF